MTESSNLAYSKLHEDLISDITVNDTFNNSHNSNEVDKKIFILHRGNVKYTSFDETQEINNDGVLDVNYQNVPKNAQKRFKSSKSSQMKINFLLLTLITFMMVIPILLVVSIIPYKNNNHNSSSLIEKSIVCLTDKCIVLSSYAYNNINFDADPCEDFYEYSCGNWIETKLIPRGFKGWSDTETLDYEVKFIIRNELESDDMSVQYTKAELKAKAYYRSCVDKDGLIEKLGAKPILDIVNKFVHLDEENNLKINISLYDLILMIHTEFLNGTFFELNVDFNSKNSSDNSMKIKPVKLDFDPKLYLNKTIEKNIESLDRMKETVKNVITLTHGSVNNVTGIADNYIGVSTKIAELLSSTADTTAILKEMNESISPYLNWIDLIQTFLSRVNSAETVNENKTINIADYQYFVNLTKWIQDGNEESVKLFLYVKLLKHLAQFASKELREQVETNMGPKGLKRERWQECIERIDDTSRLGFATSRLFLRKKMFNGTYKIVSDMIDRIRNALVLNLKNVSWMDDETYKLAAEKGNSIGKVLGYPEFLMNDSSLNLRYESLAMNETDYFNNELRLIQYSTEFTVLRIRNNMNFTDWFMTPATVNAFYNPEKNQINIPSAILQYPFFIVNGSMSWNFGKTGFTIGHELFHGFDDSGRQFDKDGKNTQWWSNKTIDAYNNATRCMINQYSEYKAYGMNINGVKTLGENIADNGGLKAAYYAYLKWIEENGEEEVLPLLNLTHKQLFFVSYAQTWCYKGTYERDYSRLTSNPHSLEKYRVLGVAQNSREFSESFNCKVGSKMSPVNKCEIF